MVEHPIIDFLPSFEAVDGRVWLGQALRATVRNSRPKYPWGLSARGRPGVRLHHPGRDRTAELERLKDDFVSTVSHELRMPLTSIRGAVGLVASGAAGVLPAKARGLIEIAHTNSLRLLELVDDLLDIQKLDGDRPSWPVSRSTRAVSSTGRSLCAATWRGRPTWSW